MAQNPAKIIIPPNTTGPTAPIALDWARNPFNVTVTVYTTGAASYDVEATLDNVMTTQLPRWQLAADIPNGQTGSYAGKIVSPVTAIRLNVASNAAALEWRVLQAG